MSGIYNGRQFFSGDVHRDFLESALQELLTTISYCQGLGITTNFCFTEAREIELEAVENHTGGGLINFQVEGFESLKQTPVDVLEVMVEKLQLHADNAVDILNSKAKKRLDELFSALPYTDCCLLREGGVWMPNVIAEAITKNRGGKETDRRLYFFDLDEDFNLVFAGADILKFPIEFRSSFVNNFARKVIASCKKKEIKFFTKKSDLIRTLLGQWESQNQEKRLKQS
ncbi:hypothetical protein [Geotalea sp. SG265]|uniref:hypothetical protein n=1 Tax=Geotalea sp. SG265 TaxID=2922867 RepID=UPI001FB00469|nr:hypothetical protein [Geotalea sp. SG265]